MCPIPASKATDVDTVNATAVIERSSIQNRGLLRDLVAVDVSFSFSASRCRLLTAGQKWQELRLASNVYTCAHPIPVFVCGQKHAV